MMSSGIFSDRRKRAARSCGTACVLTWLFISTPTYSQCPPQTQAARLDDNHKAYVSESRPANLPASLQQLIKDTAELAAEHRKTQQRIEEVATLREETTATLEKLGKDLATIQENVNTPGMETYIGPTLLQRRRNLPNAVHLEHSIRQIQDEAARLYARFLELDEQRISLMDTNIRIHELLTTISRENPDIDRNEIRPRVKDALAAQLSAVNVLRESYKACWHALGAFNVDERKLYSKTEDFLRFIDERVLWLPIAQPLYAIRLPSHITPGPGTWRTISKAMMADIVQEPTPYLMTALAVLLWCVLYPTARSQQRQIQERVSHTYTDTHGLTLQAMAWIIFRILPIPALMLFLQARLSAVVPTEDAQVYAFALTVSRTLYYTAIWILLLLFFRHLIRKGGVAETHFLWDKNLVRILQKNITWVIAIGVPTGFIANFAYYHPDTAWKDGVSRIAFVFAILLLGFFFAQLLHPKHGILAIQASQTHTKGHSRHHYWYYLTLAICVALTAASLTRYSHTAFELTRHLIRTAWLVCGVVILRAMAIRFVRVSRLRMMLATAKQEHADDPILAAQAESKLTSEAIDHQTRTLLRWLVAAGLILGAWAIWQDIIPAFSYMGRVQLWSYSTTAASGSGAITTQIPVYLSDLVFALIAATLTVVLARHGPAILEIVLLARLSIDAAARFAIVTIVRYAIVITGAAASLGAIGLGWSRVQWLAAAITVGLGFGLQEIFANFVSGIIILFERPIRIGDIVTVGGIDGKISRIQMRATTVTDWDRRELIVPNKEFITGQIINWTLSDPVTRVIVPVGVAYGADTRLARDLLLKIAGECAHVLTSPAPVALFKGFGESALDFELRVYIPNRDVWPEMIHELHTRIDDEFRKAGIDIAFPQRDIHIRSLPREWGGPANTTLPETKDSKPVDV